MIMNSIETKFFFKVKYFLQATMCNGSVSFPPNEALLILCILLTKGSNSEWGCLYFTLHECPGEKAMGKQ